jgi:hypothetical protein
MSDTETKPLRLFSHSRCESDEMCRHKRYLSSEWGGTGLTPVKPSWELHLGTLMHAQLDLLARHQRVDFKAAREEFYTEAQKYFPALEARQWAAIGEGLLRGFVLSVWPGWMAEYEVYDAERWGEYEAAPGFLFRWRQDLLLKSKIDAHIRYVEYKTTSTDSPDWIASWAKSVQLHTSMYATKQTQGIEVRDAIVQGLYKGYKDKYKGSGQRSVFAQGYANRQYSITPEYSHKYQKSKGWEQFSAFDEFDNLEEWVGSMEPALLSEQFPVTGPIFPRDDIAETWFRQQLIREREVDHAMLVLAKQTSVDGIENVLDTYFRQNFSKCTPSFGFKCEFEKLCWIQHVKADPLGSGLFVRKTPVEVNG